MLDDDMGGWIEILVVSMFQSFKCDISVVLCWRGVVTLRLTRATYENYGRGY